MHKSTEAALGSNPPIEGVGKNPTDTATAYVETPAELAAERRRVKLAKRDMPEAALRALPFADLTDRVRFLSEEVESNASSAHYHAGQAARFENAAKDGRRALAETKHAFLEAAARFAE